MGLFSFTLRAEATFSRYEFMIWPNIRFDYNLIEH